MDSPDSPPEGAEPVRPARFGVPVLIIAFNRIETLKQVFEAVRRARPTRLYVAADGPRHSHADDPARTQAVRRVLTEEVDWDCELKTYFRDENVGSRTAVGGAITWFFEHEEMGVILEDDCLPDASFFPYAEEMLLRYRDDPRVMQVNGGSFLEDTDLTESYFFSKYPHIWGWATWKESWAAYSLELSDFEDVFNRMDDIFWTSEEKDFWLRAYRLVAKGKLDSWDYFWLLSVWRNGGLSAYPTANLVKNIGFSGDAENTKPWKDYKGLRHAPLEHIGRLIHPPEVAINPRLDQRDFEEFFRKPAMPLRVLKVLGQMVGHARLLLAGRASRA